MDTENQIVEPQTETETETEVDPWSEDFNEDGIREEQSEQTIDDSKGDGEGEEPQSADEEAEVDYNTLYAKQLKEEREKKIDPILVKYKGKVIEIDNLYELRNLAERGLGATAKYQEMAEQRKMLEGITPEDIEMLKRFKQGDQSVIEELARPLQPENTVETEVNQIAQEILESPYVGEFKKLVEVLPEPDKRAISSDPRLLRGLKIDFEQGIAQKILPMIERTMAVEGLDFLNAYAKIGKELFSGERKEKAEKIAAQPSVTSSTKEAPAQDPWDMPFEDFNKLMSRGR